jgi:hypothetical protein
MNLSQKMPEKLVKWYECRIACSPTTRKLAAALRQRKGHRAHPVSFSIFPGKDLLRTDHFQYLVSPSSGKVSVDHSWYGSAFLIQGLKQRNSDEFHGPACERGPSQYNDSRQTVLLRAR